MTGTHKSGTQLVETHTRSSTYAISIMPSASNNANTIVDVVVVMVVVFDRTI